MARRKKKNDDIVIKQVLCPALNVRSGPSADASIVKIIAKETLVQCDPNFKDDEWDHIMANHYVEGYCMKQFLEPADPDITAVFKQDPIIADSDISKCDSVIMEEKDDKESKGKED